MVAEDEQLSSLGNSGTKRVVNIEELKVPSNAAPKGACYANFTIITLNYIILIKKTFFFGTNTAFYVRYNVVIKLTYIKFLLRKFFS